MKKEIIKCGKCGAKYYKGDVHLCKAVGTAKVISNGEENREKKTVAKTRKESFKIWESN